jgi:hypothetical protein
VAAYRSGCVLCGEALHYLSADEILTCLYCGNESVSNVRCAQGHYVCDACHSAPSGDVIEQYCSQTSETDPVRIALTLMAHPSVKMHGPEQHALSYKWP